jgi:hypothetical protein
MTRTPAAHRLVTKKARQERAWRRAMHRMPMRWVLPAGPPLSADQIAEMMRHAPLMVMPEEPTYGYGPIPREARAAYDREFHTTRYPISMTGVTAEEWAEHMRKVGQAYGYTAGEYSAGKRSDGEEGA